MCRLSLRVAGGSRRLWGFRGRGNHSGSVTHFRVKNSGQPGEPSYNEKFFLQTVRAASLPHLFTLEVLLAHPRCPAP